MLTIVLSISLLLLGVAILGCLYRVLKGLPWLTASRHSIRLVFT